MSNKFYLLLAVVVMLASLTPLASVQKVQAATVTTRAVALSQNTNTGTATYNIAFDAPTTTIGSMEFAFCDSALLGTVCNAPTGLSVSGVGFAGTGGLKTGVVPANILTGTGGTNVTGFALGATTNAPACSVTTTTSTVLSTNTIASSGNNACGIRIAHATAAQTFNGATNKVWVQFTTITNPTAVSLSSTLFIRIATYGTIAYGTYQDGGTVATTIRPAQTVSFKIAEILGFCVGTLAQGTVSYQTQFVSATLAPDCAGTQGTSLSLGTASNSTTTCISPVTVANASHTTGCNDSSAGSDRYAYAMVRSNGANGTVVYYRPASSTSQATLQIAAASCGAFGSSNRADQCINPVNDDQTIAVGTVAPWQSAGTNEEFGMVVPRTNTVTRSTTNLAIATGTTSYAGTGEISGNTACTTGVLTQDCWNWHRGSIGTLASSTAGVNAPIDNEALQILHAVKPATVTPTGAFTVAIDYFAITFY